MRKHSKAHPPTRLWSFVLPAVGQLAMTPRSPTTVATVSRSRASSLEQVTGLAGEALERVERVPDSGVTQGGQPAAVIVKS